MLNHFLLPLWVLKWHSLKGETYFHLKFKGGILHTQVKNSKLQFYSSVFSPDNKFIQLQKQRLNNGYHSCNLQQQNSPLYCCFNQIWIAMITIMMNDNNYYLLPWQLIKTGNSKFNRSTHIMKTKAEPCLLQKILAPETRKANFLF